jgi:hypothetical protein
VVALEIWHNQRPEDDFREGDPATIVRTKDELWRLLDEVSTASGHGQVPPILEVSIAEDPSSPTLEVGLSETRGFVHYMSADEDGWTIGDSPSAGTVPYDYSGSRQDVPARAEVSAAVVRRAVTEFLETGRKPGSVELQELVQE